MNGLFAVMKQTKNYLSINSMPTKRAQMQETDSKITVQLTLSVSETKIVFRMKTQLETYCTRPACYKAECLV